LHTLLQKHGSLDLDSTRFVIGEVVAALASIHEMGFLYGDLKPENVVITEPGHIKLTDFGGCRPITDEAKALIKTVAKDILKNLRDGDWKARPQSATSSSGYESNSSSNAMDEDSTAGEIGDDADEDEEEDVRIEGTTAYLPPEVVMGAFPTVAADAWALGCVTYQCLTGRPPLLEADDEATRNRIVSFDVNVNASQSEVDRLFEDKHAAGITPEARDMIKSLLDRDPSKRPGMNQLAEHAFFTSNIFALYSQPAYPLDVGTVLPAPKAQWSRRQFSSIWAPQPEAYNVLVPDGSSNDNAFLGPSADAPIPEGEEASGFFSPSGKLPSTAAAPVVGKRTERMMLPPS
jgi:serine/threonine protein kinase